MSYVDAVYVKDKDLINVVERVDGVRKYKSFPAHYLFYYQDNKGQYTGIDGKRLTKVAVASNKAFDKEKHTLWMWDAHCNPAIWGGSTV
jgi:hypothetical protein